MFSRDPDCYFRLHVLGDALSGKSAFLISVKNDKILSSTKKDCVHKKIEIKSKMAMMSFHNRGYESLAASYDQSISSHAIILLCDLTSEESFNNLSEWVERIRKLDQEAFIYLIGTKEDIEERVISLDKLVEFSNTNNCICLGPISSKTGHRVAEVIEITTTDLLIKHGFLDEVEVNQPWRDIEKKAPNEEAKSLIRIMEKRPLTEEEAQQFCKALGFK